jgi:hypothetical protein
VLDVVDGPRVVIGRDGLGQQCEHIAVVGGNTGGDGCLDPRMGIYVAVLDWLAADGGDDRAASPTVIAAGPVSAYSVPAWASGSASVAAAHERLSGHASRVRVLDRSSRGCVSGTTCGGAQGRNSFLDNGTRRYRGVGHP